MGYSHSFKIAVKLDFKLLNHKYDGFKALTMEILYLCGFHSTIANSPKADQIQSRPSGEND